MPARSGVSNFNIDEAIAMRILGVPRSVATPLASHFGGVDQLPLPMLLGKD